MYSKKERTTNQDADLVDNIDLQQDEKSMQTVANESFTLLFTNHNRLFVSGKNSFGQLGLGHFKDQKRFVPCFIPLNLEEKIKKIAIGSYHSLLLTNQNRVFGSGFNFLGQLSLGDLTVRTKFEECLIKLQNNETIIEMEAGFNYSQLKTNQNRIITFGYGASLSKATLFSPIQKTNEEEKESVRYMLFGL